MDKGIGQGIDLFDAPLFVRVDDDDDALVVGGNHQLVLAVIVDIGLLVVAESIESPPERRVPTSVFRPDAILHFPGFEHRLIAANGQQTVSVGRRLMEDI